MTKFSADLLTESAAGHNPSKCLENGGFDNDCCVYGTAACKDNYVYT